MCTFASTMETAQDYLDNVINIIKTEEKLQIAGAIVVGIFGFVYVTRKYVLRARYTKTNRIDGKVVIITGCNTGLGKASAIDLAQRGAKVYMACRDMVKCEAVRQEIIALTANQEVYARQLDLASLDSVRNFAASFRNEETSLDILMNNAGLGLMPRTLTVDGFEQMIGVNHLGHFLLTNLLLDLLKRSAPSRIVVLSSTAHTMGVINKDDLMLEKSYGKFQAYCNSKLANNLFTIHLAKMLEGTSVTINSVHPGAVATDFGRHMPMWLKVLVMPIFSIFIKTVENGAQTQIQVAVDPDLKNVTGKYFADCKETKAAKQALDYEMASWLWKKSAELTGL